MTTNNKNNGSLIYSDIISNLILEQGYNTVHSFCIKNKITHNLLVYAIKNNAWSLQLLKRISKIIKKDITCYCNSVSGQIKGNISKPKITLKMEEELAKIKTTWEELLENEEQSIL